MKKKTYVRVITLLLAVLMILGVMAPAFTSYAASELSVINNSKDVVKVEGTPDGKDLKVGSYRFKFKDSGLELQVSASPFDQWTDTGITASGSASISYGNLTFTKVSTTKKEWDASDKFEIVVTEVSSS